MVPFWLKQFYDIIWLNILKYSTIRVVIYSSLFLEDKYFAWKEVYAFFGLPDYNVFFIKKEFCFKTRFSKATQISTFTRKQRVK